MFKFRRAFGADNQSKCFAKYEKKFFTLVDEVAEGQFKEITKALKLQSIGKKLELLVQFIKNKRLAQALQKKTHHIINNQIRTLPPKKNDSICYKRFFYLFNMLCRKRSLDIDYQEIYILKDEFVLYIFKKKYFIDVFLRRIEISNSMKLSMNSGKKGLQFLHIKKELQYVSCCCYDCL